ncbi:hypothetical protein [Klebsiella phage YC1]|nr:hypothetical protein [Klebsiella phage YC1]
MDFLSIKILDFFRFRFLKIGFGKSKHRKIKNPEPESVLDYL